MPDPPIPPHWPPEYQVLCPHFLRIGRQPQAIQPLLLSKLSCGLRLPPEETVRLYQDFWQQETDGRPANRRVTDS